MTDYTENYERFWSAYPKRNGRKVGKKPAFNQWKKLTADEKRAAFADVEKRNRQQTWGKYIRDAQRYLRDAGWQDEIDPAQSDMYSRPLPQPKEPELELHWSERMMNRLFLNYCLACSGLTVDPDWEPKDPRHIAPALEIKHDIRNNVTPAYDEDIAAERISKPQAANEIADQFLTRLDLEYDKRAKARVMRIASKAA